MHLRRYTRRGPSIPLGLEGRETRSMIRILCLGPDSRLKSQALSDSESAGLLLHTPFAGWALGGGCSWRVTLMQRP